MDATGVLMSWESSATSSFLLRTAAASRSREAFSSFDDRYGANFKRFDGGIRVGRGLAYEMLYAEIGYDFGLSNIGDNAFDDTHNGAFFANIGINF